MVNPIFESFMSGISWCLPPDFEPARDAITVVLGSDTTPRQLSVLLERSRVSPFVNYRSSAPFPRLACHHGTGVLIGALYEIFHWLDTANTSF